MGEADFRIFTASHDMTVRLWDPFDMGCVQTLAEGRSEIASMTYFRPRVSDACALICLAMRAHVT